MTRLFCSWVTAIALATLAAACGSTSVTEIAGPDATATRCQSSLAAVPSFPATGGRLEATVAAARECAWTVNSQASWLQVSPASGQGGMTLTLTAAENPAATVRSGSVSLNGQTITLTQAASPCVFAVSASRIEVSGAGDRKSVEVSGPGGCGWTVQSQVAWISAVTASGSGSGVASFDVARNPGGPRSATVQMAGSSVEFVQAEAPSEPAPPAPAPPPTAPLPPPSTPTPPPPPPPPPPDECKGKGKCNNASTVIVNAPPGVPTAWLCSGAAS